MLISKINWKRKIYCYIFTYLEFLAIKFDFFNKLFMKCRKPAVLNEIKKAKISSTDKVLLIGCGIFPSTSLVITEETNVKLTCIDNNIKAVKLAQLYIAKKNIDDKIDIKFGDGINYQVQDFDIIFITINVWPINQILNHLTKSMKTGSKLICRGIKNDILKIFYKEKMQNIFTLVSSSEDPMFSFSKYPTTQSFLLNKK
jgi:D-arabinose 1-dehydrogenase-like Zn-dependent alcohol dehydrogenase